ncbi:MAG TPA: hypothetical protein VE673_12110 [Pseudonocardiaceae bacterium]|nr:hypothetical protein [Pseudonocardiaceae bacterium]
MDGGEHAGGVIGDDTAPVALGGQGESAEFVEGVDAGPVMLTTPFRGPPAATSRQRWRHPVAAIGWMGVRGRRTVSPSVVMDSLWVRAVAHPWQRGVDDTQR